jgi:SAM-dependent methyltransferase
MSEGDDRLAAKARAQAAIDAASSALARGALTQSEWHRATTDALAEAYLAESDPRWQSGFDGDAELWRQARSFILDAVPHSGSFLDIGAATGHLIECLAVWARDRGIHLDLFGLELNPQLAAEARRRLPAFADHIYIGNVIDWPPPRRFDYVRTGLEYVPTTQAAALVTRLLDVSLEPGGRLLVGPINVDQRAETTMALRAAGASPNEVSATDRNGKTRLIIWTTGYNRENVEPGIAGELEARS